MKAKEKIKRVQTNGKIKQNRNMKEKADPCDIEHHICQAACSLILTEKHALQYCAAAPSTRISLISPSSLTRTTISLQPPPTPTKKTKKPRLL